MYECIMCGVDFEENPNPAKQNKLCIECGERYQLVSEEKSQPTEDITKSRVGYKFRFEAPKKTAWWDK